jgi:phosphoribosylformylglycinamidine (FGAM) synthase-like enzyme
LSDILGLDITEGALVNMLEAAHHFFATQTSRIRARTFLQRRHGRRSKTLLEGAEFMPRHAQDGVEIPVPSGKDSRKRYATRHKIHKVELRKR